MRLSATHLVQAWTREDLASWENEGGAINTAPRINQHTVAWPSASIIDPVTAARGDADKGMTDTNSLTILKLSLLLLVPALGSIAIFWATASADLK